MAGGGALRAAFVAVVLAAWSAHGLYFHIGETEKRCFIEEIPDETMVIGAGRGRGRRGLGGCVGGGEETTGDRRVTGGTSGVSGGDGSDHRAPGGTGRQWGAPRNDGGGEGMERPPGTGGNGTGGGWWGGVGPRSDLPPPSPGNYRTQLWDKQSESFLPSTPGLGMHVEVKDPDGKVSSTGGGARGTPRPGGGGSEGVGHPPAREWGPWGTWGAHQLGQGVLGVHGAHANLGVRGPGVSPSWGGGSLGCLLVRGRDFWGAQGPRQ